MERQCRHHALDVYPQSCRHAVRLRQACNMCVVSVEHPPSTTADQQSYFVLHQPTTLQTLSVAGFIATASNTSSYSAACT